MKFTKSSKYFIPFKFYKIKLNFFFESTISINKFKTKYSANNEKDDFSNYSEKLAGRLLSLRKMSKDLTFADLNSDSEVLQIVFNNKMLDQESSDIFKKLKRGYILGLEGIPFFTKTGQLSLLVHKFQILSECKFDLPILNRNDKDMLVDPETRYSKRYLDLIVNNSHKDIFKFRAKMISIIRTLLEKEGFIEFETPILSHKAGGALARPFKTHSNALKKDLYLRVAPELYLKQLIISGYEKVFEIGKNFRNEDVSIRHNPEFTSVEFYHSYSNYIKLMDFTKDFLKNLSINLCNSALVTNTHYTINFEHENYEVYDVVKELEKYFNTKIIEDPSDKQKFYNKIDSIYKDYIFNYKFTDDSKNLSIKKKLEKLVENIIEPKCKEKPSFIINHPTILSPLAKSHPENKLLSERFELFINGMEVINSYSELNDPEEQRERFLEHKQLNHNYSLDHEIHPFDGEFVEALSYGMPPTAGWGMGIDRMCMLFLGLNNIKEVILFPLMNVTKH